MRNSTTPFGPRVNRRAAAKTFLAAAAGGFLPGATERVWASELRGAPEEKIRTQVCVVGGGSGGLGAALAASRAGAKVVLLEREEILGGTSTGAYVNIWRPVTGGYGIPYDLFQAMAEFPQGLLRPADGDLEALYARSQLGSRNIDGKNVKRGANINFEPRALSYAARSLLDATGCCQVLLNATVCRVRLENDTVQAVEAWYCGKRLVVEADVFIDCTADGDVCAEAGCAFHLGEDPKSRYQEPHAPAEAKVLLNGLTLCYRIFNTGVAQKPALPKGVKEKSCTLSACFDRMPNGEIVVNVPDMIKGNALLHTERSELMRVAQQRVLAHLHALQQLPADDPWAGAAGGKGWGTWAISSIAPRLGVRETRRMLTDYVLNENDCLGGLKTQTHPDLVAIADHSIDIHGGAVRERIDFLRGPFGIPYRCLLPQGMKNLMIASRSMGYSHLASGAARLQRTLLTLGQAAGNAAAMAARQRVGVRAVDVSELQKKLKEQNVDITARPEQG